MRFRNKGTGEIKNAYSPEIRRRQGLRALHGKLKSWNNSTPYCTRQNQTGERDSAMNRTEFYDCARALFGVEPEYPWPDEPGYAVLRHPDNRKWFAVVMDVPRDKLGLSGTDALTVVNLKGDPLLIGMLHSRPGFFPAYHMNKEHWISAALDGSVDTEELRSLLAESFARTAPKKRAPRTKGAAPAKPGGGAG